MKWHDGAPFTSDDMVFTFGLYRDREVPVNLASSARLMVSASAPDPLTFVVSWSAPFVHANRAEGLIPMPRHILEETFRTDKANLIRHPWFTTEFVGLGPYRVTNWDFGVQVDYSRFDDYYRGRPHLDRLIVKLIPDANALVANILAGAVDAVLSEGIDIDASMSLKERWETEGVGNEVLIVPYGGRGLEIQHRPQYARPVNGLTQLPVRKGMYSAINRQQLVDVFTYGHGHVADSWVEPWNPLRAQLEAHIPQFPYDPRRAQQYLAEGGWVRGTDGIMVHQQTGDRFNIMIYSSQGANVERAVTIMGEDWKAVGADVEVYTIPISLASDREHRAKLPGAGYMPNGFDTFTTDRLNSRYITGPENNWSAINRGGYSNPRVDAVLDKLVVTIDPAERLLLHRDLLREQMGDVALFPLFYETQAIPRLKGVKNLAKGAWNVFDWDKA